ncbi:MAG TPA: helix-turn-helix domain-containing protein [Mycobacterium sp.]|nr:helix-turn-helix domain-containing protein [Mycobacterium sp.]
MTVADDVIARDLVPVGGVSSDDRAQLSNLYSIFVLSSLMFDGRGPEAIFDLFEGAAPSIADCQVERAYRLVDGSLVDEHAAERTLDGDVDSVVMAAVGADREIDMPDGKWRYALTLRAVRGIAGVVVVRAASAPPAHELFLLKALAQQVGAAITAAELVASERDRGLQLYELTVDRERTIKRLSQTVDELNRRQQIHEQLTEVSGSGGGEAGVAEALNRLTSLAVSVEDVFGNVRAATGEPRPDDYRPIGGVNRDDVLRHAAATGSTEREGDRLFRVVRPRTDVLGVLVLHDPTHQASTLDIVALEYAAAVLAVELSHQRALAETELRLRLDLVEDLLAGTDDNSALARGEALGLNFRRPHAVSILQWDKGISVDRLARAARHCADRAGVYALTARRSAFAILLTDGAPDVTLLFREVSAEVGSERGSIGIGSVADTPSELPRSFSEARRALHVQRGSVSPYGARQFSDLGVYRIFDPDDDRPEVRGFLTEWIGSLQDYDRDKKAELVKTLARYLDLGGSYDQTAESLSIHRSTLRYRLARIREISGRDLTDADTRLNMHLATRLVETTGGP